MSAPSGKQFSLFIRCERAEFRSDELLLFVRNAFASIVRSSTVDLPMLEIVFELYVDVPIDSLGLLKDLIETGYCPKQLVIANPKIFLGQDPTMLKFCIHHVAVSFKFPQTSDIDRRQRDEDDGVIVHGICENCTML